MAIDTLYPSSQRDTLQQNETRTKREEIYYREFLAIIGALEECRHWYKDHHIRQSFYLITKTSHTIERPRAWIDDKHIGLYTYWNLMSNWYTHAWIHLVLGSPVQSGFCLSGTWTETETCPPKSQEVKQPDWTAQDQFLRSWTGLDQFQS
jgi:hypothetical protein